MTGYVVPWQLNISWIHLIPYHSQPNFMLWLILDMKWMWNDTQRWFAVCWRNWVLVGTASELQWSQKGIHLKLLSNRLSHLSSSKKYHLIRNWRIIIAIATSTTHFPTISGCSYHFAISKKELRRQRVAGWFWYWLQQCGCQQWEGTTGCERSFCHGFRWDALWGQEGGHCARFLGRLASWPKVWVGWVKLAHGWGNLVLVLGVGIRFGSGRWRSCLSLKLDILKGPIWHDRQ